MTTNRNGMGDRAKPLLDRVRSRERRLAELNAFFLASLNIDQFLRDAIWASLSDTKKPDEAVGQARMRRAVSIWGKDPGNRVDAVLRFLSQLGFSQVPTEQRGGAVISADLIVTLQQQTPKSVLMWAQGPD